VNIVASLAAAQLRHRPGRWALLVVGVALAGAIPVVAAGAGDSVAAQTVRKTVEQMSPGDRTVTVLGTGTIYDPAAAARVNTLIRQQLARLSSAPVRREIEFHPLSVLGSTFLLGAADELPTAVRLLDGRMPRSCPPKRCEVVAIGGDQAALTRSAASLGLVVVGQAERTDATVLSGELDPGGAPLLLGDGADRMARVDDLALFPRTYGWVTQLDVARVIALGVPAYARRSAQVADTLIANVEGAAIVNPDVELTDEYHRASLSARRFGLLGGTAAVLLLGFAAVAAVGLRREHAVLVTVLRRRGARIARVGRLTTLEAAAAGLCGAVLGCAIGAAVTAGLAQNASLASWRTIWHALGSAWPAVGLLCLAAVVVTVAVLLWPDRESRTVWRTVELIGAACLGAVFLAASRGSASASSLAANSDPLVVALPALAGLVGGLVAARLWAPLARFAERLVPRRSIAGRIGLLGAIRRPLRPVVTTAFLTAAVSSVVFSGAYRATLQQGSADQAAYTVPLDATLTHGRDVPTPLAVTGAQQLAAAAPGAQTYGAVRTGGIVRTLDGNATGVPVLGVDRDALSQVRRWSRVTGTSTSPASFTKSLGPAGTTVAAPSLPDGARTVTVDVTGLSPAVDMELWLASADGQEAAVKLSRHGAVATGTIPHLGRGALRAVSVALTENIEYATHHQHAIGESNTARQIVAGTFAVGAVSADGATVPWQWAGWGSRNAQVVSKGTGLRISYRLEGSQVVLVPGYVPKPVLRVIVDPVTARSADQGRLTLSLGQITITAQVVGTMPRFPTTTGTFVLADQAAVSAMLELSEPGTGAIRELWVSAPDSSRPALERALAKAPYDRLTVALRAPLQARLSADPVARGSQLLLALIAGLALLVGVVALALLVIGERRDDAGELHAWEADGLRPATLRRVLFVRASSVVAVALPFGLLTGLLLARAGTTLVAVDASGVAPRPPLQAAVGLAWTGVVLVVGIGLSVAVAWAVAARMLRERLPVRPETELR
jgi:hypothetical protein